VVTIITITDDNTSGDRALGIEPNLAIRGRHKSREAMVMTGVVTPATLS
jgi:hypothetical protein